MFIVFVLFNLSVLRLFANETRKDSNFHLNTHNSEPIFSGFAPNCALF